MKHNSLALFLGILFCGVTAFAQNASSPVGFWKTIDDATNEPRAIVEIKEVDGKLFGNIVKTFPKEGDKPNCTECTGDKKDKPIVGLEIIWDLKKEGDEYRGGYILDPKNGKTYKAKMSLQDNGEKLKVRGFIGFSLLGRTQVWLKSSAP
jgi:uncharacterized protein (DUF2147 family)